MSLRILLAMLAAWLDRRHQDALAYLIEENRILREHVRGPIRLTDEERRHRPISAEFFIDRNPQWLLLRTYLDRTLHDEAPERGLAVSWTFLEMRTDASTQAAK